EVGKRGQIAVGKHIRRPPVVRYPCGPTGAVAVYQRLEIRSPSRRIRQGSRAHDGIAAAEDVAPFGDEHGSFGDRRCELGLERFVELARSAEVPRINVRGVHQVLLRVAGRIARGVAWTLAVAVGGDDDDVVCASRANRIDQRLYLGLDVSPGLWAVDRLVEDFEKHVWVAGKFGRDVSPEGIRIRRRVVRARYVVDLVEVDDDVQILAGGVVDRRLENLADVVGGVDGCWRLWRAAAGAGAADGIRHIGAVGTAGVVVDLGIHREANDVTLDAGGGDFVHASRNSARSAEIRIERADVDERRAAQDDGFAARILQLGAAHRERGQSAAAGASTISRGSAAA